MDQPERLTKASNVPKKMNRYKVLGAAGICTAVLIGALVGLTVSGDLELLFSGKTNPSIALAYQVLETSQALVDVAPLPTEAVPTPAPTPEPVVSKIEINQVITAHGAISINGRVVAVLSSPEEADKLLKAILAGQKPAKGRTLVKSSFVEKVEILGQIEEADVISYDEAYLLLTSSSMKKLLNIKTVEAYTVSKTVQYSTKTQQDDTLDSGKTKTLQNGKNGKSEVTYEVTIQNGKEVSRKSTEKIIEEPIDKIIAKGTKVVIKVSGVPSPGSLDFGWPVKAVISSYFGSRWGKMHYGLDIAADQGAKIAASEAGTVIYAAACGTYGLLVKIDHGNSFETRYAHCSKLLVKVGDKVEKGQTIALVGSTGHSTGPHVHFEIRYNNTAYNPLKYL